MGIDCQSKMGFIPCKIGDEVRVVTPERITTKGTVTDIFFIQSVQENKGWFALALDDKDDLVTIDDFDIIDVLSRPNRSPSVDRNDEDGVMEELLRRIRELRAEIEWAMPHSILGAPPNNEKRAMCRSLLEFIDNNIPLTLDDLRKFIKEVKP